MIPDQGRGGGAAAEQAVAEVGLTAYHDRLSRGERVDLRPVKGERVDAGGGLDWGSERVVEASMLVPLLTAPVGGQGWTFRPLRLAGARIVGDLDLEGATLTRPLHLEDCFFERPIALDNAQAISMGLTGCHLPGIEGHGLHTRGDLLLNDRFIATEGVRLDGACIGGTLDCDGGSFTNEGGAAVDADGLVVNGSVWFEEARLTGEVNLVGAHVGGQLVCSGGSFTNEDGVAFNADGLIVDGGMFCRTGFAATGEVRLLGAHVGGQLVCSGGSFTNEDGVAFNADGLVVDGGVFCRTGFAATGEVRLLGAHVGGQLDCTGGTFSNEGGVALNAAGLVVEGGMFCGEPFAATGEVRLLGARIGGQLWCTGGSFINEGKTALDLERAEIGQQVLFRPARLVGAVDLTFAKVGAWYDSATSWPNRGELRLDGFTYADIDASPPISVRRRLDWLSRDVGGFAPQPYEQLAAVYRREGNEHDARQVQIRAQWRRRSAVGSRLHRALRPVRIVWSALLWATIGYGYRPWQIVAPIGLLYGYGCWWFTRAARHGTILRAKDLDPHVHFNGARYAADLLIPGASIGERGRFLAVGDTAWWAAGYTLAGWALAAMLIAGLTGIFKRQ